MIHLKQPTDDTSVADVEALLPPTTLEMDVQIAERAIKAPSGYRIEQAVAAWQSARARLLHEDDELAHDESALIELIGAAEGDIETILARVLRAARHAKAMADAAALQIEEMQTRKARYSRRNDSMRATAFALMDALGKPKMELPDLTATIRKGQPSAVATNEDATPDIYVRIERKPDRATILSALKAGIPVEGWELSNSLPTLSIRTK